MKTLAQALLSELDELDAAGVTKRGSRTIDLRNELRTYEIALIEWSLRRTAGHQTRAARLLGLKPTTLNSKLKLYGILPRNASGPSVEKIFSARDSRSRTTQILKSVAPEVDLADDEQSLEWSDNPGNGKGLQKT